MNLCAIASHQSTGSLHRFLNHLQGQMSVIAGSKPYCSLHPTGPWANRGWGSFYKIGIGKLWRVVRAKEYKLQRCIRHSIVHLPVKIPVTAKIHPLSQEDKYLLQNIRLNNIKRWSYPQPGTLFSRFIKMLHIPFVKPHWLNTRRKDTAYPTYLCQYPPTSSASLDMLEKYVLVYQNEMNGRTQTVDSPPKKTGASTTKALQFLASSHLVWKLLDGNTQKEKQSETWWSCVKCPLSSPCCLPGGDWTQVLTPHRRKLWTIPKEAAGSASYLSLTCSQQIGRARGCAQPPAQFSSLRSWEQGRVAGQSQELQPPLAALCTQGWKCLWSWWVNSFRSGSSHQGRVSKLLQCSCDSRPCLYFCIYWHRWTFPMLLHQACTFSSSPFEENSVVFSWVFSFFSFYISNIATTLLLQTLTSVILCAADILIPTAEPKEYFKCYWRTVSPSSVCLCTILPSSLHN